MANKTIAITSELYSGTVGMKLFLLHPTTGAIGNNASGDVLTEGSNGLFTTVVDEAITGWYRVLVTDSVDSPLIEGGWVLITSDTVATYVVDNPQSVVGAIKTEIETTTVLAKEATSQSIKAKTDNLPADPASTTDITSLQNNAPTEAY